MTLSDKMKQIRQAAGISQAALGEILNTGKRTISDYETGKSKPGIDYIKRFCEHFSVSLDELADTNREEKTMAKKKKDFTTINTGRADVVQEAGDKKATESATLPTEKEVKEMATVQKSIGQATSKKGQQGKVTPQEAADRLASMRTQGRKGVKATRINMAFSPDNHEFIKVMAKATGKTMTELTNDIITAYRSEHPEFMAKAADFLDFINSGAFTSLQEKK